MPHLAAGRILGVEVTRIRKRNRRGQLVGRLDPYGNTHYCVGGRAVSEEAQPGTDVAVVRAGRISVTPIALDLTSHALIEELGTWDRAWTAPVTVSVET